MHVIILVASYPPILDSAGRLYSQLAEDLTRKGHDVTVITEYPDETDMVEEGWDRRSFRDTAAGSARIRIVRVPALSSLARVPGGKAARFVVSCLLFAVKGLLVGRPDVVLVYSPPLFMGISGRIIATLKRSRMVLNVQDIHPKVLFDTGAIQNGFVKRVLSSMEDRCYEAAACFIVPSPGYRDYLAGKDVNQAVFVIPNWVDIDPVASSGHETGRNTVRPLDAKCVVSYSGTMQDAQGLEIVVEAAQILRVRKDIMFVLAGEGSSKATLARLIEQKGTPNVLLSPALAGERYAEFMDASDICVVMLSRGVPAETVPGKLADIMGRGKPVVAAVSLAGDAARIVREAECGFCVESGDAEGFSNAVLRLREDEELRRSMGEKGRAFARRHFSRRVCVDSYEDVLVRAAESASKAVREPRERERTNARR